MNNRELPFYGIKGTIKEIHEQDNYYVVTRYGASKKDNDTVSYIKKTESNEQELFDEYQRCLKGYLDKNSNKYKMYCNELTSFKHNKNFYLNIMIASALTTAISGNLLLTNDFRGIIGIVLGTCSLGSLAISSRYYIKNTQVENKKEFIKEYEERVNEYSNLGKTYNKENSRGKTEYTNLQNTKKTVKDISLVRTLKKETAN